MNRFSFESASADIVGEATQIIDEIVEYIKSNDIFQVDVIGYTDTVGDNASNEKLSLLRAKKIADLLKAKGVDEKIISLEYYGEANQIVKTADEVSNKENRRVEVTIK
ncbi:OmpA family protein [Sulfurimonas sp.]